ATLPGASQSGTGREELRAALDAIPGGARAAVFVGTAQVDEEVPGEQLSELLALLQGAQASEPPLEVLVVVTRGSQEPSGDSFHAASAALWGLARS
ncbi:unnamed protein product, partial [Polarella glacialis]